MWKRLWRRATKWLSKSRKPDEQRLAQKQAEFDAEEAAPAEPDLQIDPPVKQEAVPDFPAPEPVQQDVDDTQPLPAIEPSAPEELLPRQDTPQRSEAVDPLPSPVDDRPGEEPELPPAERVEFYDSPQPDMPPQPTDAQLDQLFQSSENDEQPPLTNKVRVPPELQGQDITSALPPGLQLLDEQKPEQQLPPPQQDAQDKPMTEAQGDRIIQLLDEQNRVLENIAEAQGEMASAIENMAIAVQNAGGVI